MDSDQQDPATTKQPVTRTSPLMYAIIGLCFVVIVTLCVVTLLRG